MTTQRSEAHGDVWIVEWQRIGGDMEQEEFHTLTAANKFYDELMDSEDDFEFINEPWLAEGADEKFIKGKTMKSESIEDLRDRSVSSGTLKSEDLIPKFLGVLKTYGKDKYDAYIKENPEVEDWENLDEETMGWVVDELTDLLNEIAPDGCYFGASDGDGADFGFWSMSNESKKSEADGNKDIFTLDLTRIDADGDEEGLDDMQAAQTFYDEDDAIKAAKELADSYKDDDGVVQVIVMAGEQEKPNGDIVGDSFDIYWASSSDKQTTADYRKKARYAAFDNKMDYYAKGGKSEGNDDDKGCKGKDCKDDKTKKNEADATFKVGDFVNYDAESDGDKLSTGWAFAEVVAVNDDGTLKLQPYNLEDYEEVDGVNPQFCEKMEHFAGMTDANTYYMDGKYNVYTGYYEIYVTTKELGKPYGFAGTLDSLDDVEQLMDYYDETMVYDQDIQDEVMSAVYGLTHYDEEDLKGINFADLSDKTESKKSEGLPPKKLGDRRYRSRADLINKMKQLGATEITTRDQYDELRNKQWLHKGGYAMDINGNLVGQTYFGDKDGKWYYASSKTFQGDYLPECKQDEASPDVATIEGLKSLLGRGIAVADNELRCKGVWKLNSKNPRQHQWTFVGDNGSISVKTDEDFKVIRIWGDLNKKSFDLGVSENKEESKKSESLTLKQKELKDMARFGQAEDITTISDEEAKALRKKGIETVGISRGTYGMNGALLRDNEGKKYVITARSSNLFYFV